MDYITIPGILKTQKLKITANRDEVFKNVCKHFEVNPIEVMITSRKRKYVVIRQITMFLFCKRLNCSLTESGAYFKKHHATVIHSINTVANLRETSRRFREETNGLFEGIKL